ncbi:hypothetical protein NLJ89_g10908 [Agrocybe chaxingu]|uniref:Uncharacterized protein n=1 Tax=Agrocybe chaxingu TaxID=84603 RepID=A0A9W8JPU6_9AGAR|nr:hypothetical protein NLJ89_g10908 [Agrocybe chaxingu]
MASLRRRPRSQPLQSVLLLQQHRQTRPPVSVPIAIKQEPISPAPLTFDSPAPSTSTFSVSSSTSVSTTATAVDSISVQLNALALDEKTRKAAEADPDFAAALIRKHERELEDAKLQCSLENKEAMNYINMLVCDSPPTIISAATIRRQPSTYSSPPHRLPNEAHHHHGSSPSRALRPGDVPLDPTYTVAPSPLRFVLPV